MKYSESENKSDNLTVIFHSEIIAFHAHLCNNKSFDIYTDLIFDQSNYKHEEKQNIILDFK